MELSHRLKKILKIPMNFANPIVKAILQLEKDTSEFINGIGYLDITINNPNKISYVTESRKSYFIRQENMISNVDVNSIVFLKETSYHKEDDPKNNGMIVTENNYSMVPTLEYSDSKYIFSCKLDNGYIQEYRMKDLSDNFYYLHSLRVKYAYMVKPGKIVTKLFNKDTFTPFIIEEFSRLLYISFDPLLSRNLEFKIVRGKDIVHFYSDENYDNSKKSGNLWKSCMRNPSKADFFNIYIKNKVKMVILQNITDKKIVARALLWPNVKLTNSSEPRYFLDRIYTINDKDSQLFLEFGKKNKWIIKNQQSYSIKKEFRIPEDKYLHIHTEVVTLELSKLNFRKYPYLDTFTYMNKEKTKIYNDNQYYYMKDYVSGCLARNTNFYQMVYCELLNVEIRADEAIYSDFHNGMLPRQDVVTVRDPFHGDVPNVYRFDLTICRDMYDKIRWKRDCVESKYRLCKLHKSEATLIRNPSNERDYCPSHLAVYSDYYECDICIEFFDYAEYGSLKIPYYLYDYDRVNAKYQSKILNKKSMTLSKSYLGTEGSSTDFVPMKEIGEDLSNVYITDELSR